MDASTPPEGESPELSADLTVRATLPRSIGLSLAINAVPDAYLLLDSPHCAFRRLAYIQGNHDLESTLTTFPGLPRVTNTELSPLKVIKNRDADLREQLLVLASRPASGAVLVDAVAMAQITATDYGRLCDDVAHETGRPVLAVPHRSLTSDYLTAYADVTEALAAGLPLSPRRSGTRRRVAIVGYLWDRNEGDHRANRLELHRLFQALDLDLVAVWLSGQTTAELQRVQEADLIISLPYGRRAATVLADRLGCQLVRGEVPFGVAATLRFLFTLGAATGREAAALRFAEQELAAVLPKLKWAVPFAFLHRRLGYVGDPHLYVGMRDLAALLGCSLRFAAFTNLPRHARDAEASTPSPPSSLDLPADIRLLLGEAVPPEPATILSYPHARELEQTLERLGRDQELDLLVTNSFGFLTRRMGIVELGFPSYHSHALAERPFLGTRGALSVVERMMEALRAFEVRAARGDPDA
ncbi:MAG: hypothetical protein HY906_21935 [Deltaproteobacteria bacterium]|nr:hypothetical protein [Deltaproteobacteria bacterium]